MKQQRLTADAPAQLPKPGAALTAKSADPIMKPQHCLFSVGMKIVLRLGDDAAMLIFYLSVYATMRPRPGRGSQAGDTSESRI
ncbi:hypothetical protein RD149_13965 [Gordonia westfalica]|uniref:Uncharacterized protein n=1 Tax=Gordonia westfalica TaxID=158898 RepID=A0ABU2GVA2_9ACTN|nr:hypothetical protein [Gordonia westfalica]MDS1114874.1 hypothetical protein [Gordonia westfalica]